MTDARQPGWPHPWNGEDHCEIHGYEPIPDEFYKVCGECHHVFVTAAELVLKDSLLRESMDIPSDPEKPQDIAICPECTHDF